MLVCLEDIVGAPKMITYFKFHDKLPIISLLVVCS